MKKCFGLVFVMLFFCVSTVCASETSEMTLVTDDLGREIALELPVERIISLAPSNTEVICSLDMCDLIIAADPFSNYPAQVVDLPEAVNMDQSINEEVMLSLQPDVVLMTELQPEEDVVRLEALGFKVFFIEVPEDFEGIYDNLRQVAQLGGKAETAEELIASLEERVKKVDDALAKAEGVPTVFYEMDATDIAKPWTSGEGTFIDMVINRSGGKNVAAETDGSWVQFSLETLISINPDIIILGDANYGVTPENVRERVGWDALTALDDAVFPMNDDIISRPGPRLVDAYEQMAMLLHPEVFEN